jgi:hypothetical protein
MYKRRLASSPPLTTASEAAGGEGEKSRDKRSGHKKWLDERE